MSLAIRSLALKPFGRFDDAQFTFAPSQDGADFHLIVGDNEAGKTTLRHALVGFLFGVSASSPYLYRARRPRLSGAIEVNGDRIALERVGTGRAATPAAAAARLNEALSAGRSGPKEFLITRAFSHSDMRVHADALKESRGDLPTLITAAAGGLRSVNALEKELCAEEEALFSRDKRKTKTRYRSLLAAWERAQADYQSALLDAPHYAALLRERDRAIHAEEAARRRHGEAKAHHGRLKALCDAQPIARELDAVEVALRGLPSLTLAPEARDRVHALASDLAAKQAALAPLETHFAAIDAACAALQHDPAALDAADTIEDLALRAAELRPLASQRRAAVAAQEALHQEAFARAKEIGRSECAVSDLAQALPPPLVRRELNLHMGHHQALADASDHARAAIDALERLSPPPSAPPPGEALVNAIGAFEALGRFEEERQRLADAAALAHQRHDAASEAARGDLRCDAPPPPEVGANAEARIADARCAVQRADDALVDASEAAERARQTLAVQRAGEVPTITAIEAARAARDALWRDVADGRIAAAAANTPFLAHLATADRLADDRFDKVELVVAAQNAERAAGDAAADVARRSAAKADRLAALRAAETAWADTLAARGLPEPPADYGAWHTRRTALIEAAAGAERAEAARAAFDARIAAAVALAHGATNLSERAGAPPRVLFERLRAEAEAAKTAFAAATQAAADYRKRQDEKPTLAEQARLRAAALTRWQDRWVDLLAACTLPPDLSFEGVRTALDAFDAIARALDGASRETQTVTTVDRFEAELRRDMEEAAARLGEDSQNGIEATAARLTARLNAARQARDEARRLSAERVQAQTAVDDGVDAAAAARVAMAADLAAANLPADAPAPALIEAARQSDERRVALSRRAMLIENLGRLGLSPAAAEEALAADTSAARLAALDEAAAEIEQSDQAEKEAIAERARTQKALEDAQAASRPARAADAKFKQRALEQDMADTVAEALRLRLETMVLSHAREAFAREHKSPILARASGIFATLTGGAYDRLEPADPDVLTAHRVEDDLDVPVDGLSDGTRDQLIIAVRLAAAADRALPFIADDLFVNTDDTRAGRGFEALAALSLGRQVFYLTHHDHLVRVAQSAVGARLTVRRLSAQ